ncbi:MAG: signal recognition particle-docking protein FtsY [Bacilli bacterium]
MGLFKNFKNLFTKEETKKYDEGLAKTRGEFVSKLGALSKKYKIIDENYFEELENILVMADIGINTVVKFVDNLKDRVKKENITSVEYLKEIIVDELLILYVSGDVLSSKLNIHDGLSVVLVVGVNGVGKTTSIGKLAYNLKNEGKKVMLIAADTFRAGAIKQLEIWSEKIGVSFYSKEENSDPASVVYSGLEKALKENIDVVLVDTAGRLQNKTNLMNELDKINRVIKKFAENEPSENLLVIDANTGQNGISQAKEFKKITNITGIILTKLDGTSKGGIVLAIKDELSLPVKYVGLGEKETDLEKFDIEKYIYGLFKDL